DPWWYDGPQYPTNPGGSSPIVGQIGKVVAEFGRWTDRDIQIVGSPSMINTTKFRLQGAGVDLSTVRHDPW
ncbi:MAG: flavoprotein, partial [Rhodococcus sp. (in: high G+C Gram-positive bacteria)]